MTPGLLARVRWSNRRTRVRQSHRSARHSARAVLALGCCIMLAATIGMSAALETVRPEWRDPEFGHRLTRLQQFEREAPGRPLVLFLGTSRAQNALDPSSMTTSNEPGSPLFFNFGQSGSSPLKVLLTLLRVLDAGIRPAAVVVEVLPPWLGADGPAEGQFSSEAPRLSDADLRHLMPYCTNEKNLRSRWLSARVAPWHAQRAVLMSHWLPRWLPWDERVDPQWEGMEPDGFVPFPKEFGSGGYRRLATEHARQEYAGSFAGIRLTDHAWRVLGDLTAQCRSEGIAVALVEPPVSPMFRGWYAPGVWASGNERLQAGARERGLDFFPVFEELGESDFIDGHHMLQPAAARYSQWLADTHLKPWLVREGVAR